MFGLCLCLIEPKLYANHRSLAKALGVLTVRVLLVGFVAHCALPPPMLRRVQGILSTDFPLSGTCRLAGGICGAPRAAAAGAAPTTRFDPECSSSCRIDGRAERRCVAVGFVAHRALPPPVLRRLQGAVLTILISNSMPRTFVIGSTRAEGKQRMASTPLWGVRHKLVSSRRCGSCG